MPKLYTVRKNDSQGGPVIMTVLNEAEARKWGLVSPEWEFVGWLTWDEAGDLA
jgi:hypothetical protein